MANAGPSQALRFVDWQRRFDDDLLSRALVTTVSADKADAAETNGKE